MGILGDLGRSAVLSDLIRYCTLLTVSEIWHFRKFGYSKTSGGFG